ncbi:MAG TPA: branched-chain amino acid ABC transporter permease [Stellaceae bacterium]|jgi:branched-chain amino acid transport system permease protein|nr:branched-chain amino acid ABC transporter permease [Stellaceae bacterium]
MATLDTSRPAAPAELVAGLSLRAWKLVGLAAVLAAASILPFVITSYQLLLATQVIVYAVALLGLNILTGYNGQFSLGHGAFYAIGAYTTAILLDKTGIPYWATIPVAGFVCLAVGFLFGLPALRLEGHYLALATFALAIATPQLLKFKDFDSLTGGVQGIVINAPDTPFGLPIRDDQWLYFFCLFWTIPLFVIAWNLLRGRTGRALVAIRDHPLAAQSMGIDTATYKSITFGVSAMYTGIAGALGALLAQFVSPDSFDLFLSIRFLVGIVVGGLASMTGAFFGAIFVEFVPNLADLVSKAAPQAIYGAVLIGCMYLMPTGVMGLIRGLGDRLRRLVAR